MKPDFISFVEQKLFEEEWSLDACANCALEDEFITIDQIVCTKHFMIALPSDLLESRTSIFNKTLQITKRSQIHKNKLISARASRNVRHPKMTEAVLDIEKQISLSTKKMILMMP